MQPEAIPDSDESEEPLDQSAAWRFGMFRAAGFEEWDAVLLSRSRVDWHAVRHALDTGCTHEQALRIFL